MWFHSVLDALRSAAGPSMSGRARPRAARKRPAARQLRVEALEERCLLSFNLAVPHSVGLVGESATVGAFNNDDNHDLAAVNSGSLAAGREAHESHHHTASCEVEQVHDSWPCAWYTHRLPPRLRKGPGASTGETHPQGKASRDHTTDGHEAPRSPQSPRPAPLKDML
jgi:hypothetical protein